MRKFMADRLQNSLRQLLISGFFLAFGIYSVVSMERNFHNASRLAAYVVLIVPAFLCFHLALLWYDRLEARSQVRRRHRILRTVSRSAPQNLIQYVLAYCLPFFSKSQAWPYQAVTMILLASTLWEPLWTRLFQWWAYRRVLQAWSLVCAGSFLFPFFWPHDLTWFYGALACAGALPFIPVRRQKHHVLGAFVGILIIVSITLGLPSHWRFPVLSIWIQKPKYEWDTSQKDLEHAQLGDEIGVGELAQGLASGHELCCVAPVVAPPKFQEKLSQEWLIDHQLIERRELPTAISGNLDQHAFRSFYCKRNFPALRAGQTLHCRLYLPSDIALGDVRLHFKD